MSAGLQRVPTSERSTSRDKGQAAPSCGGNHEEGHSCSPVFELRRRLRLRNRSYGTSIIQGGNASRPGCCYQAMLARDLNLDYANFGFAGKGRCEREVAEFLSEVEASCFVNTS